MGSVLRGKEISQLMSAACNITGKCFYFPVRHHSPACAYHLKRVITEYRPDCILIEGPENANELIGDMTLPKTEAPFCIYYSYRDSKAYLDDKRDDYRCYYPFLDYSPELVALREGARTGAALSFMDLPYEEILIAEKEGYGLRKEADKNSYNDDGYLSQNAFIESLVERSGLRSFDEFWERYFEMEGLRRDTQSFLQDMLYYCVLSRANTGVDSLREDGCLAREAYMRAQIGKAMQKYERVLVVTGGFHVAGLVGARAWLFTENGEPMGGDLFGTKIPDSLVIREEEKKLKSIDPKDKGVYLMSYSMEAADRLNGYCSGMPYPMFYQRVWEELEKPEGKEDCYERIILEFLVECGRRVRRKEAYPSTYDEICAFTMCRNLALLRAKPFPGAYELQDSVLSNYVKGEYQLATDRPMRVLREELTGKRIGTLPDSVKLPPLCADFEKQCKTFRLDIHASLKKELTLSPFAKKRHRELSAFCRRMTFLETGFCICKKGPNLRNRAGRNLIREIWEYHFSVGVFATLIENSVYGGTIEEACKTIAGRRFQEETDAAAASDLIISMFEMGLSLEGPALSVRLGELIRESEDFFALTKTFANLIMLLDMRELYGYEADLLPLRNLVAQKLLALLEHMTGIRDEDVPKMLEALKELYRVLLEAGMEEEKKYFWQILEKMSAAPDLNPSLAGTICGLLYVGNVRTGKEVSDCMQGYLRASGEKAKKGADFVRGLFYVARDILFAREELLEMLDGFLKDTPYDIFMGLLPSLRLAFSFFTPMETDRIAGMVAGKYGLKKSEFKRLAAVSDEEFSYGRSLEEKVLSGLKSTGEL